MNQIYIMCFHTRVQGKEGNSPLDQKFNPPEQKFLYPSPKILKVGQELKMFEK